MSENTKTPFWKKWWVWVIAILVIGAAVSVAGKNNQSAPASTNTPQTQDTPKQEPPKQESPQQNQAPQDQPKQSESSKADSNTTNNPKISKAEYDQIHVEMTYDDVVKIIGGPGAVASESGKKGEPFYSITYKWDGETGAGSYANLTFQNGKLKEKTQSGLK